MTRLIAAISETAASTRRHNTTDGKVTQRRPLSDSGQSQILT
jgi:hypothetical protein